MRDTRLQPGTRHCKTIINHANLTLTANKINTANSEYKSHIHPEIMDNPNRLNRDRFPLYGRLKYHWGADDEIMKIFKRKDNSPETRELIEKELSQQDPATCVTNGTKIRTRNLSTKKN